MYSCSKRREQVELSLVSFPLFFNRPQYYAKWLLHIQSRSLTRGCKFYKCIVLHIKKNYCNFLFFYIILFKLAFRKYKIFRSVVIGVQLKFKFLNLKLQSSFFFGPFGWFFLKLLIFSKFLNTFWVRVCLRSKELKKQSNKNISGIGKFFVYSWEETLDSTFKQTEKRE